MLCGDVIAAVAEEVLGVGGIDRVVASPCRDPDAPDIVEREVKVERA